MKKRITRQIDAGPDTGQRVWLDQYGHWTKDEKLAFEFDEDEAAKRIKRIPHAETIDKQENRNHADASKE